MGMSTSAGAFYRWGEFGFSLRGLHTGWVWAITRALRPIIQALAQESQEVQHKPLAGGAAGLLCLLSTG